MSARGDIEERMDRSLAERQLNDIRAKVAAGGRIVPWQMGHLMRDAEDRLSASRYWKHSVSGGVYDVLGITLRETDMAPMVRYVPVGEGIRHRIELVRPLSEWLEIVDVSVRDQAADVTDVEQRQRFVPVKEQNVWVEV